MADVFLIGGFLKWRYNIVETQTRKLQLLLLLLLPRLLLPLQLLQLLLLPRLLPLLFPRYKRAIIGATITPPAHTGAHQVTAATPTLGATATADTLAPSTHTPLLAAGRGTPSSTRVVAELKKRGTQCTQNMAHMVPANGTLAPQAWYPTHSQAQQQPQHDDQSNLLVSCPRY